MTGFCTTEDLQQKAKLCQCKPGEPDWHPALNTVETEGFRGVFVRLRSLRRQQRARDHGESRIFIQKCTCLLGRAGVWEVRMAWASAEDVATKGNVERTRLIWLSTGLSSRIPPSEAWETMRSVFGFVGSGSLPWLQICIRAKSGFFPCFSQVKFVKEDVEKASAHALECQDPQGSKVHPDPELLRSCTNAGFQGSGLYTAVPCPKIPGL